MKYFKLNKEILKDISKEVKKIKIVNKTEIPENERVGYMNDVNTFIIIPKIKEIKEILDKHIVVNNLGFDNLILLDNEININKIEEEYKNIKVNEVICHKYDINYLKEIFIYFNKKDYDIILTMGNKQPLKIENDNLIIYLAGISEVK